MGLFGGGGGDVAGGFMGFPSVGGTLWQTRENRRNWEREADYGREMANASNAFNQRMSNTAHQREVADLKAAGLNPVLSGTGGAGASSGPGAMASTPSHPASQLVQGGRMDFVAGPERDLAKAQAEAQKTAADVNRASEQKIKKETQILAPKGTLMEKVDQMFKSGAKQFRDTKDSFDRFQREKNMHPDRFDLNRQP